MEREDTDWVNGKGVNFVLCLNPQIHNSKFATDFVWSRVLSRSIWGINPIKLVCLPVVLEFVPCHSPYNTDQVGWGELFWRGSSYNCVFVTFFPPRWHCKTSRERPPCWQRDLVWRLKRTKTWLSEFLLLILFLKIFVLTPRLVSP